jgi:hypothetical protein
MFEKRRLKLIPDQDECSEPFFKTEEEYQAFRDRFSEGVREENEKWRQVRLASLRQSMFRFVR